jgi:hypothetical protein
MLTNRASVAALYAHGYEGLAVIKYRIPASKVEHYLWPGRPTSGLGIRGGDVEYALRRPLPGRFIVSVHEP